MTDTVATKHDDNFYWAAGTEFVEVLVNELNGSLQENGVSDAEQRRKICSQFVFGIGNFLDQYGMEVEGKKRYPLLCFTDQFLDMGVPLAEIEPLYLPVKDFEFHGAASDVADEYFGSQNEQLSFRIGPVGEE